MARSSALTMNNMLAQGSDLLNGFNAECGSQCELACKTKDAWHGVGVVGVDVMLFGIMLLFR